MEYKKLPENAIENKGQVLTSKYYHNIFPEGVDSITNSKIKKVEGKDWEIFNVSYETKDAYYGMPMEGLGLMNCMILKKDTRSFLEEELTALNDMVIGMYGSHTGKDTGRRWNVVINPIKNLVGE